MGNCIEHESQVIWGGEDWTPALMTKSEKLAMEMEEEQQLIRSKRAGYTVSKVQEVKVKITKKQLEEWLGRMDVQHKDLCVEQTLGELMKVGVCCEMHQRSWRPRLKSIPEV